MRSVHKDQYNGGIAITPKTEMVEGGMIYNGEQVRLPSFYSKIITFIVLTFVMNNNLAIKGCFFSISPQQLSE